MHVTDFLQPEVSALALRRPLRRAQESLRQRALQLSETSRLWPELFAPTEGQEGGFLDIT